MLFFNKSKVKLANHEVLAKQPTNKKTPFIRFQTALQNLHVCQKHLKQHTIKIQQSRERKHFPVPQKRFLLLIILQEGQGIE